MHQTAHRAPPVQVEPAEDAGTAAAAAPAATGLAQFRETYGRLLEWVVGALMIILFAEVTLGVVFRAIGHSLVWYDEIASVLLAWLTFYGSALASVKRAHISCPELVNQLPPGGRRAVNVVAQLLVIGFFGLFGWIGASVMPILATDTLVSLPTVPMNVVQSVVPISCALILVGEFLHLVDLLRSQPGAAATGSSLSDGLH